MSEKIVQLSEKVIKGQIKELCAGQCGGDTERITGTGSSGADSGGTA